MVERKLLDTLEFAAGSWWFFCLVNTCHFLCTINHVLGLKGYLLPQTKHSSHKGETSDITCKCREMIYKRIGDVAHDIM